MNTSHRNSSHALISLLQEAEKRAWLSREVACWGNTCDGKRKMEMEKVGRSKCRQDVERNEAWVVSGMSGMLSLSRLEISFDQGTKSTWLTWIKPNVLCKRKVAWAAKGCLDSLFVLRCSTRRRWQAGFTPLAAGYFPRWLRFGAMMAKSELWSHEASAHTVCALCSLHELSEDWNIMLVWGSVICCFVHSLLSNVFHFPPTLTC